MGELLPAATATTNGLMPKEYRSRIVYKQMPLIDTKARLIAEYEKVNTYYGHAIRLLIGSFKTSCDLILWCDHSLNTYVFNAKGYGTAYDGAKIIISETDSKFLVYITGTYSSQYSASNVLLESTSDIFKPVNESELVEVSSLSPFKTINISDCLIGG